MFFLKCLHKYLNKLKIIIKKNTIIAIKYFKKSLD